MDKYYYIDSNNQQAGPVSPTEFKRYGININTLVWRHGMSNWMRASQLPELIPYLVLNPHNINKQRPSFNIVRSNSFIIWILLAIFGGCLAIGIVTYILISPRHDDSSQISEVDEISGVEDNNDFEENDNFEKYEDVEENDNYLCDENGIYYYMPTETVLTEKTQITMLFFPENRALMQIKSCDVLFTESSAYWLNKFKKMMESSTNGWKYDYSMSSSSNDVYQCDETEPIVNYNGRDWSFSAKIIGKNYLSFTKDKTYMTRWIKINGRENRQEEKFYKLVKKSDLLSACGGVIVLIQ